MLTMMTTAGQVCASGCPSFDAPLQSHLRHLSSEAIHDFTLSFHANIKTAPQVWRRPLPTTYSPIHYSLMNIVPFDSIYSKLLPPLLYTKQVKGKVPLLQAYVA